MFVNKEEVRKITEEMVDYYVRCSRLQISALEAKSHISVLRQELELLYDYLGIEVQVGPKFTLVKKEKTK